jgi:hypothetical protein
VGKWTGVDPKEQFFDKYAYAGNGRNPLNARDNDGGGMDLVVSAGFGYCFGFVEMVNLEVEMSNMGYPWLSTAGAGLATMALSVGTSIIHLPFLKGITDPFLKPIIEGGIRGAAFNGSTKAWEEYATHGCPSRMSDSH